MVMDREIGLHLVLYMVNPRKMVRGTFVHRVILGRKTDGLNIGRSNAEIPAKHKSASRPICVTSFPDNNTVTNTLLVSCATFACPYGSI